MGVNRRRWPVLARYASLTLLTGLALALVACTDGDDEPAERVLDAETATAIAQAGLLAEADLPDAPWITQEADVDLAPGGDFADELFVGPECEALARLIEGRQAEAAAEPLAGSGRHFEAEEGLLSLRFVSSTVTVFETVSLAEQAHELMADVVSAEALLPCFEEGLGDLAREQGVEVRRMEVREATAGVEGSHGLTAEMEIFAVVFAIDLDLHIHSFQREHAVATMLALEINSDIITDAQQSILDAFEGRVVAALEGS